MVGVTTADWIIIMVPMVGVTTADGIIIVVPMVGVTTGAMARTATSHLQA
jgi:hypothetical protein